METFSFGLLLRKFRLHYGIRVHSARVVHFVHAYGAHSEKAVCAALTLHDIRMSVDSYIGIEEGLFLPLEGEGFIAAIASSLALNADAQGALWQAYDADLWSVQEDLLNGDGSIQQLDLWDDSDLL